MYEEAYEKFLKDFDPKKVRRFGVLKPFKQDQVISLGYFEQRERKLGEWKKSIEEFHSTKDFKDSSGHFDHFTWSDVDAQGWENYFGMDFLDTILRLRDLSPDQHEAVELKNILSSFNTYMFHDTDQNIHIMLDEGKVKPKKDHFDLLKSLTIE